METIFEELPERDITDFCEACWEDEGFHFSWCPTQQEDVLDIPLENVYNQTIDEEVELLLEDEDL